MTDILITFISESKDPIDIINEIKEVLNLNLTRNKISEFSIEIGDFEAIRDSSYQLIHKLASEKKSPKQKENGDTEPAMKLPDPLASEGT